MADGRSASARAALVAAVAADQHAVLDEAGHERHAEPARQVVVARARGADGVRPGALAQRADRRRRSDAGQRLQCPGHVGPGEAEVAVAPVALGDHEAAVDELSQVHARGGGRDAGLGRPARWPAARGRRSARAAPRARPGSPMRAPTAGEIGVPGHAPRVAKRRFVLRRSLAVLRWRHDLPAPHAHARRHVRRDVPRPARRDGRQRRPAAPARRPRRRRAAACSGSSTATPSPWRSLMLPCGDLGDRHGHKRVVLAGPRRLRRGFAGGRARPRARRCSSPGASCRAPAPRCCCPARWRSSRARTRTRAERARAIGIWAAISSLALPAGVIAGGALVDGPGWRWAFLVNLPIVAVALPVTARVVRESREAGARAPDVPGAALAVALLATADLRDHRRLARGRRGGRRAAGGPGGGRAPARGPDAARRPSSAARPSPPPTPSAPR